MTPVPVVEARLVGGEQEADRRKLGVAIPHPEHEAGVGRGHGRVQAAAEAVEEDQPGERDRHVEEDEEAVGGPKGSVGMRRARDARVHSQVDATSNSDAV